MAQYDFGTLDPATVSGTALASDLTSWRDALNSAHSGAAAPTYAIVGTTWLDNSASPWTLKQYDGASWVALGTINPTTHVWTPTIPDATVVAQALANPVAITAGGTANALTATLATAPQTALADRMHVRVRAAAANTGAATFDLTLGAVETGALPIRKAALAALEAGDIAGAGHELDLQYNATAKTWLLLNPALARRRLSTDVTYYVSPAGNDSTGTGTSANPWLTITTAYNYIRDYIDLAGHTAVIKLADGTYSNSMVLGVLTGAGSVIIAGNPANIASVVLDTISVVYNANVYIENCTIQSSTGDSLLAYNNSCVTLIKNIAFGTTAGNHMFCSNNSTITVSGVTVSIVGNAWRHLAIILGGRCEYMNNTITAAQPCTFSAQFVLAESTSIVHSTGCSFSGTFNGTRYTVSINGVIVTSGSGANYFPGTSAGSATLGGQYV